MRELVVKELTPSWNRMGERVPPPSYVGGPETESST